MDCVLMAMLVIRKLNENKQTAATNVNVVGAKPIKNSEIASEIKENTAGTRLS